MFVTDDGDYTAARKAKDLTYFIEGAFHANDQYGTSIDVFKEGGISGLGANKIYPDIADGTICSERVFHDSIIVDDVEARMRKPRNLYEHREVSREVLMSLYPKKKGIIRDAEKKGRGNEINAYARLGELKDHHDPVTVYEAWHLPSHPGAKAWFLRRWNR